MLSFQSSKYVNIELRVFTAAFLFMSLVIHVTNVRSNFVSTNKTLHVCDLVGYRYMAAAVVIGLAYSILQTVIAVIRIKGNILLDFYGDKVVSTIIATGAVAGFVMTGELQKYIGKDWTDCYHTYFIMSHAADGLAFLGFVGAFISSIISSYALPNRV
ncbi:CASP-like protein 4D1 [Argentina anserina]|uniref:CASP-like protein 4D1 n=1 Tax=Argentina anserina TaxID=57926 RepID=UPI00217658EE|nr:CASP-like protein 4D1 [Potentilla anserina]